MTHDDLQIFKFFSGKLESTRIFRKYKKIDNPYNTYLNYGLPIGPINNPGMNAIFAASNPVKSDFLYFVANGEGTHIFNHTYKKHLTSKRNVSRKFK